MARTSTIDRQVEFLTSRTEEGLPANVLEIAWQPAAADVRKALARAKRQDRVTEVSPGVYKVATGTKRPTLARRDLESLIRKLRKAIQARPPASQALALARLLLNLEDEVSSNVLDAVATAAESARREAPDDTRAFLDEVLQLPAVRLYPRQRSRLALAYVGTLSKVDDAKVWRAAFEECYLAAIEAKDLDATLAALQGRVVRLIEIGAQREAEAELRHALMMMEDVPAARLAIQTQIARLLTSRGDLDEARAMLEGVVREAKKSRISVGFAESSLNSVLATQLEPAARERLRKQFREASRDDDYAEASIAASLGAGLAFIYGDGEQARLLARDAALHGTRIGRNFRDAERGLIEVAFAFAAGELDQFQEEIVPAMEVARSAGHLSALRALISLRLRWQVLTMDRAGIEESAAELQEMSGLLQQIQAVGLTGIEAAADLAAGRRPRLIPGLRDAATYWGLGGVLAGLEVLATGGSRASAMGLVAWGDEAIAQGIVTAPDWPAHLERVVPLAMLRLGKQQRVPERLAKAAEHADALNHPIEAAIARLQYAEVAEAINVRTQGEAPGATRERAVEELLAFGIPPEPLALTATQAVLRGSNSRRSTDLSKGQADVLQLLAEGLTYKETAEELGLSWRTVQTQAKYAYAKLGAHDKKDAVARARRRGEI